MIEHVEGEENVADGNSPACLSVLIHGSDEGLDELLCRHGHEGLRFEPLLVLLDLLLQVIVVGLLSRPPAR